VAAVVGAEVVATAGEAARYRGGCLRWRDHQCHLPRSLQLFGFNDLVVAPRRETRARAFSQWRTCWGYRHCWRVVGAEVAAAVGAGVVASAGEPLGASYPVALLVWR
jgi:anti-sigma-K factor RskA